jgi:PelA/Pel-15E family pectate lyase
LDEVVTQVSPFDVEPFVSRQEQAEVAVIEGIQMILDAQIQVVRDNKYYACPNRTNWCAQHDPVTLEPVAGRNYEPVSYSGEEGMVIVDYLMNMPNPSAEVKEAITGAYLWAKQTQLTGYALATDASGNNILAIDENSTLWPRFSRIPDGNPIFCDRGCVTNTSLMYTTYPDVRNKVKASAVLVSRIVP